MKNIHAIDFGQTRKVGTLITDKNVKQREEGHFGHFQVSLLNESMLVVGLSLDVGQAVRRQLPDLKLEGVIPENRS